VTAAKACVRGDEFESDERPTGGSRCCSRIRMALRQGTRPSPGAHCAQVRLGLFLGVRYGQPNDNAGRLHVLCCYHRYPPAVTRVLRANILRCTSIRIDCHPTALTAAPSRALFPVGTIPRPCSADAERHHRTAAQSTSEAHQTPAQSSAQRSV
jgi:hypothetical protein